MSQQTELSYFDKRMLELGATPENRKITVVDTEAEFPAPGIYQSSVFTEDKRNGGNIKILITTLSREMKWIEKGKINKQATFITRLHPQNVEGDNKYKFPHGQGIQTFYPSLVQDLYENKTETDTLVITEGAFKAWKGSQQGIPTIGLSSISHYRDGDGLIKEIVDFIKVCKVKNVVILWDGDCIDISRKAVGTAKDLASRIYNFFNAAVKIRKFLTNIKFEDEEFKLNVLFKHIKTEVYMTRPKGLDDLLIDAEKHDDQLLALKEEIVKVKVKSEHGRFFKHINITASTASLYRYLCLDKVETFYARHCDLIGEVPFIFKGDAYQYNDYLGELELKAPEWAKDVLWIGDEFFLIRNIPGPNGTYQRRLIKHSKSNLVDRYGKDFQKYIRYFDGFCNVPSHLNYKPEQNGFYNRYFPFRIKPAKGAFDTILGFVKHIFGNETITYQNQKWQSWELGLDYLQLLLTAPTQTLPVLCLFSLERNTGKSTFGNLLRLMFSDNVVKIGNNDLRSQFNEPFADKLVAVCEETLLDRKKDAEFIKALSTENQILVNAKGQRQFSIPFFCKFVFMSNNRRMIYMDKNSHRFWMLQVRKPEADNPNIMDDMEKEMPAFVSYLMSRQLATPKCSRMYFHYSMIRTKAFYQAVSDNMPVDAATIREGIRDMFLDFREKEIWMPLNDIIRVFFNGSKDRRWVKEILQDHLSVGKLLNGKGKSRQVKGTYPCWTQDMNGYPVKDTIKFNGRPYVFKREQFVLPEDEIDYEDTDNEATEVPEETTSDIPKDDLPF